jgi:hypothetical protein
MFLLRGLPNLEAQAQRSSRWTFGHSGWFGGYGWASITRRMR